MLIQVVSRYILFSWTNVILRSHYTTQIRYTILPNYFLTSWWHLNRMNNQQLEWLTWLRIYMFCLYLLQKSFIVISVSYLCLKQWVQNSTFFSLEYLYINRCYQTVETVQFLSIMSIKYFFLLPRPLVRFFKTCLGCSPTQNSIVIEKYALTNYKYYIWIYISFMYNYAYIFTYKWANHILEQTISSSLKWL